MTNKKVINFLYENIQGENELPSFAGRMFTDIIENQFQGQLGQREIAILSDWLKVYSKLDFHSQNELADKLLLDQ